MTINRNKIVFTFAFLIGIELLFAQQNQLNIPADVKLIWNDEFEIDGRPNSDNWGYEYGLVRNEELQWYQPQNVNCKNGILIIEGKKEKVNNPHFNPQSGDWRKSREYAIYTSACIITKNLQEWPSKGYFEIRAKVDTSCGSWPAIWLLGTNDRWPFCGEIDIMEFYRINRIPTILANVAWGSEKSINGEWRSSKIPLRDFINKDLNWSDRFHTWSMNWDDDAITIALDGLIINKTMMSEISNPDGTNPFGDGKNHYMLLNLAIGSNGGVPDQSQFPLHFEVDYVRVYKKCD